MRTRSQARRRRQPQVRQTSVESSNLEKPDNPPIVTMADNRTMAQLLEAPTEGYEDAIVIPEITANNFEIKHGLLNLVQNKQFFGNDKEDPHAHIRYFNKITSTMKIPNVPNTSVKLMLFPFSLEGAARIWLEKEPPRSIETWDDLTFYEAWDRFNDLLRGCPHHGFSELHQLDTFYNALNSIDQDSLNSAAGANTASTPVSELFLDTMPTANNGSTKDVQPPVVQIQSRNPNPENQRSPVVVPVITTYNALADLGAALISRPYSVWNNLSLPELTQPMTLELADRSITKPIGIAEDVFVNVGKFQFPADFVVVDFEPDPRSTFNSRAMFLENQSCFDRCL
ncbi:reverse transcriptase domain-containing protein [Tanacetum coccineum]